MASQVQNLLQNVLGDGSRASDYEVTFNFNTTDDSGKKIQQTHSVLVKSTALPTRSHEIIDVKYRGRSIPLRGQTKFSQTWECTFYLTPDHGLRLILEKMMESLDYLNSYTQPYDEPIFKDYDSTIIIMVKDFNDKQMFQYILFNVFPIEIGSVSYDYSQPDTILEIPVTFAYSYYVVYDVKESSSGLAQTIKNMEDKIKNAMTPQGLKNLFTNTPSAAGVSIGQSSTVPSGTSLEGAYNYNGNLFNIHNTPIG